MKIRDIFVIFSPEREDPGNEKYTTHLFQKLLAELQRLVQVGVALYQLSIEKVVPVSSTKVEIDQLLENIHRAVNIGLVNEMKIVADRIGVDIFEVVDVTLISLWVHHTIRSGQALLPIDPFYLTWKAREYGLHTFIELSGEINRAMPDFVIKKLIDALNTKGKPLMGSKIMVLGIAYKKNVDDMRESPSVN